MREYTLSCFVTTLRHCIATSSNRNKQFIIRCNTVIEKLHIIKMIRQTGMIYKQLQNSTSFIKIWHQRSRWYQFFQTVRQSSYLYDIRSNTLTMHHMFINNRRFFWHFSNLVTIKHIWTLIEHNNDHSYINIIWTLTQITKPTVVSENYWSNSITKHLKDMYDILKIMFYFTLMFL